MMKKYFLFLCMLCSITAVHAVDMKSDVLVEYTDLKEDLMVNEYSRSSTTVNLDESAYYRSLTWSDSDDSDSPADMATAISSKMDERYSSKPVADWLKDPNSRWAWNVLRDDVTPHTFLDDMTWVGVPVFLAGLIAKGEKKNFRQDYNNVHSNTRLITHFKTSIDDYTQFFGPMMTVGLKLGGIEGRSDWARFGTSALLGYAVMAGIVNGVKYTAKEMRPDGSTANSWPSGHTATSFVGATILHKEYGLTHSPWYSVAGYSIATATGIMRVLNNRHWVSDVLSGAGIGIVSGELGYALGDLIFKNKGLRRNDLAGLVDVNHPSFFNVSMGLGLGNPTLSFDLLSEEGDDGDNTYDHYDLRFQTATAVAVEGAYFFNKYIGVGGRLRVKSTPIKGWDNLLNSAHDYLNETLDEVRMIATELPDTKAFDNMISTSQFTIESDHLTEFAADLGVYFNFPLSSRFAIGTKALAGRSIMQELDLDAQFSGNVINMLYNLEIVDSEYRNVEITDFQDTGEKYDYQWDYAWLSASNSTKWGTGISLTYAYRNNFRWQLFADFDYTKKDFTLFVDRDAYAEEAVPNLVTFYHLVGADDFQQRQTITKKLFQVTLGASFSVSF
jgi:hypothetical protein